MPINLSNSVKKCASGKKLSITPTGSLGSKAQIKRLPVARFDCTHVPWRDVSSGPINAKLPNSLIIQFSSLIFQISDIRFVKLLNEACPIKQIIVLRERSTT